MARACEFKGETVERLIAESNKALRDNGFSFNPDKILFKQIPYTMAKFSVQGKAQDIITASTGINLEDDNTSESTKMGVAPR